MDLATATGIGDKLVAAVAPFCSQVAVAGSVRRQKPEVKDIEVVALPTDPEGMIAALAPFGTFIKPGTPEVIPWEAKPDARYLRMMLAEEIKLDLFIGNPHNLGALLTMRTGSGVGPRGAWEGFIPALFGRWKEVSDGGRMLECLPTLPDGRQVSVPTEAEFFRVCGVQLIPPQERATRKNLIPIPGYHLNLDTLTFV